MGFYRVVMTRQKVWKGYNDRQHNQWEGMDVFLGLITVAITKY